MRSYLYAYADAHEMLMQMLLECSCMHATWLGPPSTLFFSLVHRIIALALYKGLHADEARPVQMGGCRAGPDSRALRVELAEMLNIP